MVPIEKAKAQFETNVFGVMRTCKKALPMMREQKSGIICNISSIGGIWGQPCCDIYCSSKFALEGLTESMAPQYKLLGIKVHLVEPAGIITKFGHNASASAPKGLEMF
eukprot:UN04999